MITINPVFIYNAMNPDFDPYNSVGGLVIEQLAESLKQELRK